MEKVRLVQKDMRKTVFNFNPIQTSAIIFLIH